MLRSGRIENNYPALVPRESKPSPERELRARAGNGGATLSLEVGDGTIRITQLTNDKP